MPAVIRVSAVYTMSDQVSSKLAKMATKVTALERSLGNASTKLDNLGTQAKNAVNPLSDVNKQLTDMKKTVGTAKGSSGLIYRVDQLNSRLKSLAGGKGGHKIKVSTTGVKASERDLVALQAKAEALTANNYRIKLEVDRSTTGLLREQADALERVAGSIKEVKLGFSALKQGEAELRTTMRAKTQAAENQRKTLGSVERQMTNNVKAARKFQMAARDGSSQVLNLTTRLLGLHQANVQAGDSFWRGTKMGAGFARSIPMIAAVSQVAAVAVGGLGVMVHGLIAPMLSAMSSMKDMVGVVGLLPAAYGGAAVAIGSFMGAMNSYFGSALTNAGKLNEIQKKLDTVKDAEERKTLLEQQSKLLGEMNPKQQALAEGARDLMKSWREMFTSNEKLQQRFFNTANHGIRVGQRLIKRYGADIQSTANEVRMLAHGFIDIVDTNEDVNAGMKALFRIARGMVSTLSSALEPLLAFFGRVLIASEGPMARIGASFEGWATSLNKIDVGEIERFLTKGVDATAQWWRVLKNIAVAFGNIFKAGEGVSTGFEEATKQFREFTESAEGFSLIQREFKNGMKVAKALGRFIKEFVYQFMLMGADGEVGSSVVEFIDLLTAGLPRAFDFMRSALKNVGPSLTSFLGSLGGFIDLLEASQGGLKIALDALTQMNQVLGWLIQNVPGLKELVGLIISFKVASLIFGGAFGHIFSIMSGGVIAVGGLIDKFKRLKSVMKGMAAANAVGTVSEVLGGGGMVAGGRGVGSARRGVDVSSRGVGKAGFSAGDAALGASNFAPLGGKASKTGGMAPTKAGKVAGAAGKIPVVGKFLQPLIKGVTRLARAFGPIGLIITAVILAVTALTTNFAGIRDEMAGFATDIKDRFLAAFSKLSEALGLGKMNGEKFGKIMKDVGLFMQSLGVAIIKVVKVPLAQALNTFLFIIDAITAVVNFIKRWWDSVSLIVEGIVSMDFGKIWEGIKGLFTNLPMLLWDLLTAAFSRFGDFLGDAFGTMGKKLAATFDWVGDHVQNAFAGVINSIIDMVNKIPKVDIDKVGGGGDVQGLGARFDNIDSQAARAEAARTSPAAGQPGSVFQGPAAPGKGGRGRAAPATPAQTAKANDATMAQAAVGKSSRGVVVAYDPGSVKAFGQQSVLIQKSMKKIQVNPFFVSKPLKVAMDNGTKILVSSGAKMADAMDKVGQNVNASVQSWADKVEKALASLGAGSAAAAGGATSATPASTDAAVKKAGGGFIVPGDSRKGDSVHALLKPGEVVLNEGQQRKLGMANVNKSLHGPGTAAKGTFGFGNMTGAPSEAINYASGGTVGALKPYMDAAVKLGGVITSTTGGGHAANSQHYTGHAFDSDGGPAVNMKTYRAFEGDAKAGKVTELFFDPAGGYSGGRSIGAIGGHDDHLHTGIRGGAGGAANIGGAAAKLPKRPGFGNSGFGRAVDSRTAGMVPGLQARLDAATGMSGFPEFGAQAVGSAQQIGQQMAASMYGWSGNEWSALKELWRRESNWNPTAENKSSGAYGIPQALPASKLPAAGQKAGGSNPAAQIGWGLNYIKNRPGYGTPSAALAHHDRMNWYGRGGEGLVTSPTTIGVGDKREHVQITPSRTEATPGGAISSASKQGPSRATVTNNFYIGVLTGDEKTMRQLADMVGNTIADQVEAAAGSSVADSVDVMGGNG